MQSDRNSSKTDTFHESTTNKTHVQISSERIITFVRHEYGRVEVLRIKMSSLVQKLDPLEKCQFSNCSNLIASHCKQLKHISTGTTGRGNLSFFKWAPFKSMPGILQIIQMFANFRLNNFSKLAWGSRQKKVLFLVARPLRKELFCGFPWFHKQCQFSFEFRGFFSFQFYSSFVELGTYP